MSPENNQTNPKPFYPILKKTCTNKNSYKLNKAQKLNKAHSETTFFTISPPPPAFYRVLVSTFSGECHS